ncbi:DNA polymerase III subunit gamma/tau [Lachnoclostridium sp. Marseille-P6806]|uniref:DNA polymerase III subunit gamma/tau n=1 Tax=Lachnoclostridium sp. Marseille-P6806 TaxID=2364793 RepID=UPI0010302B88|nr:DNA polymerase III subunit gamma/tau [Lachnoclostridium sp. Marseille-P6806]
MSESKAYLALYRKYRPQTFEDVRGRDTIVRTLKNQINSGRTSHSYLFCGTRGTGKTTIAKIFARAVNCEHPQDGSPCGECPVCLATAGDANLNVVEMDAASHNGVDDIRGVIDSVSYSPTIGRKKVYIIDEVHMLSNQAFNALLKTLEEPPEYAVFILCTTEPNKLPVTILSRCQRYDFGRLSSETIEGRLLEVAEAESLDVEEKALHYIAGAADGSMRDGLSLLDQCNAFNYGNERLTYERTLEILGAVDTSVQSDLYRMLHTGDAAGALSLLETLLMRGRELTQFVADFIWYLRGLMLLKASEKTKESLDVSRENLERMLADARDSEMEEIHRDIRVFSELAEQIRYSGNRRILTEMALIRVCRPAMDTDRDALPCRIHELESNLRKDEQIIAELHGSIEQLQRSAAFDRLPGGGAGQDAASGSGFGAAGTRPSPGSGVMGAHPLPGGMERSADRIDEPAGAAPRESVRRPVLPSAVPEDIRKVVAGWPRLYSRIPDGSIKGYLHDAHLELGEDGKKLIIRCENFIGCSRFTENEENRSWLENYLASASGRRIDIEYRYLDNGEKFTDNHIDLRDVVAMEIDVDEDDADTLI